MPHPYLLTLLEVLPLSEVYFGVVVEPEDVHLRVGLERAVERNRFARTGRHDLVLLLDDRSI